MPITYDSTHTDAYIEAHTHEHAEPASGDHEGLLLLLLLLRRIVLIADSREGAKTRLKTLYSARESGAGY